MVWKTLDTKGNTLFGNVLSDITLYLMDSDNGLIATESVAIVGSYSMPTSAFYQMGNWCLA